MLSLKYCKPCHLHVISLRSCRKSEDKKQADKTETQRLRALTVFPRDDSHVTVRTQQSRALQLSLVLTKSNRNNHQRERDNREHNNSTLQVTFAICFVYHAFMSWHGLLLGRCCSYTAQSPVSAFLHSRLGFLKLWYAYY
jgi:hypothetical protein